MSNTKSSLSRRDFLTASAASAATAALMASGNYAHAQSNDVIRIGLIGCGGRGTDAAKNAFDSSPNVELVAMGDLFQDRLEGSRDTLRGQLGNAFKVTPETSFVGFDAYK